MGGINAVIKGQDWPPFTSLSVCLLPGDNESFFSSEGQRSRQYLGIRITKPTSALILDFPASRSVSQYICVHYKLLSQLFCYRSTTQTKTLVYLQRPSNYLPSFSSTHSPYSL